MQHYANAKPTAGALVARAGELLLLRRAHDPWRGYWNIPGGFLEEDEHYADGARREVFEETGVPIRVTGWLGAWLHAYESGHDGARTTMNCFVHAVPTGGPPGAPDPAETAEVRWFRADALPTGELAFPEYALEVLARWVADYASGRTVTSLADTRIDRMAGT